MSVLSEDKRKARRRAYHAVYNATPEARASQAAYRATPEARAKKEAYKVSPKGRAAQAAYRATPEARAKKAAWVASPKGRAAQAAYFATPEARAAQAASRAARRAANPEKYTAKYRAHNLRKYGLTADTYEAIAQSQNGTCAICDDVCTTGRRLAVDHCHDTGKIRGLLCASCNTSLGKLKDSPAILATALGYLLDHGKALSTEDASALLDKLHHCT